MENLFRFAKKYQYIICVFAILLLSIFLRFYSFSDRFGLAYDQARDGIVAREALRTFQIPLIGPFASAGQFVYGPQWYWVLMLFISIAPRVLIFPWIIQSALYVGTVFLMILIGKEIGGKSFGLLTGLLAAVSAGQVSQAVNLSSPSMVGIMAVCCIYIFILFLKKETPAFAGLLGFLIGNAIAIHFQAVGLIFLGFIGVVISKRNRLFSLLFFVVALVIPFIPLLIFDLKTNFFESRHILSYYMAGYDSTSVPKRWLTYVFVFWPEAWTRISGGTIYFTYPLLILVVIAIFYSFLKKRINKFMLAVCVFFIFELVLLRYYKGPLFDSYLVALHPVLFILSSYALVQLIKLSRYVGIVFLFLLILGSISMNYKEIHGSVNSTAEASEEMRSFLADSFPGTKFAVYDYGYNSTAYSLPLVLYLQTKGEISDDGYRVGFGKIPLEKRKFYKQFDNNSSDFLLADLESSSSASLTKDGWAFVNPSIVYSSTVAWWYKEKNL